MEKDYFRDRPEKVQYNIDVIRGNKAYICLKKMQPHAKILDDLSYITITANLTSQHHHPRGQKVRGYLNKMDIYGNNIFEKLEDKEEVVGRCTYLIEDNGYEVPTTEGMKNIVLKNNRHELIPQRDLENEFYLYMSLRIGDFVFKIHLCKFKTFKSEDEVCKFVSQHIFDSFILDNGFILLNMDNKQLIFEDFEIYYDGKKFSGSKNKVFDYIWNNYEPLNKSSYSFNKKFSLKFENFFIKGV